MRKFAVLAVLAVLTVAVSTSVSAGPAPLGGMYEMGGGIHPCGMLAIANGEGQHFVAFDAHGNAVMDGVVHAEFLALDCPNNGPDRDGNILHVVLEQGTVFSFNVEDPEDWMWD